MFSCALNCLGGLHSTAEALTRVYVKLQLFQSVAVAYSGRQRYSLLAFENKQAINCKQLGEFNS